MTASAAKIVVAVQQKNSALNISTGTTVILFKICAQLRDRLCFTSGCLCNNGSILASLEPFSVFRWQKARFLSLELVLEFIAVYRPSCF